MWCPWATTVLTLQWTGEQSLSEMDRTINMPSWAGDSSVQLGLVAVGAVEVVDVACTLFSFSSTSRYAVLSLLREIVSCRFLTSTKKYLSVHLMTLYRPSYSGGCKGLWTASQCTKTWMRVAKVITYAYLSLWMTCKWVAFSSCIVDVGSQHKWQN